MQQQSPTLEEKLALLADSFQKVLYEDDETFLTNMRKRGTDAGELRKYRFWEWTQGVGVYGFWNLFRATEDRRYFDIVTRYYDTQLETGLPAKNVNTCAPLLALSCLYEYTKDERYGAVCREWADWIMTSFPRTEEGGFQHITSDCLNEQELWVDTLFMTVLFLANYGKIKNRTDCLEEAKRQFLLHEKRLADPKTGLWYHGWTYKGRNNFTGAFWGRGNCWATIGIPAFLSIWNEGDDENGTLKKALLHQIETLCALQDDEGMWHTLLNESDSYAEASATSGIAYGILLAVDMGLAPESCALCADRALPAILRRISADGKVEQVSYGTPMGRETLQFYRDIPLRAMPYGQALAMLFLVEERRRAEKEQKAI